MLRLANVQIKGKSDNERQRLGSWQSRRRETTRSSRLKPQKQAAGQRSHILKLLDATLEASLPL